MATCLEVEVDELLHVCAGAESWYTSYDEPKKSGGVRTIYKPNGRLKVVQHRILKHILDSFLWPEYLQGGVKGRSYKTNAQLHAGKVTLVHEDIQDFYPSVTASMVMSVWCDLCAFPTEIGERLTELTTYRGFLPQGAPTSTHLGNLVLFDVEPTLNDELTNLGFFYSRYVDDMIISAEWKMKHEELALVRQLVCSMLQHEGLEPNLRKRSVQYNSGKMQVHGLNVNRSRPTRSKAELANIRTAVHQCECQFAQFGNSSDGYKELYYSTLGRVNEISDLNSNEANQLLARLRKVVPTAPN